MMAGSSDGKELTRCKQNITSLGNNITDKGLIKLNLCGNAIEDASELSKCKKLQWCNIAKNMLRSMEFVMSLRQMKVLNLGNNQIQDMSPVAALTNLQALMLNNNLLKKVSGLEGLTQLNTLVLSHNELAKVEVSFLGNLRKLQLSHNEITEFPNIKFMPELSSLSLNENLIEDIPADHIGTCQRLKLIELGKNRIKKMKHIKALKAATRLNQINLKGNPVCEKEVYQKMVLKMFPSLKTCDAKPVAKIMEQLPAAEKPGKGQETSKGATVKRKQAANSDGGSPKKKSKVKAAGPGGDGDVSGRPPGEPPVTASRDTSKGDKDSGRLAGESSSGDQGEGHANKGKAKRQKKAKGGKEVSGVVAIKEIRKTHKRDSGRQAKGTDAFAPIHPDIGTGMASSW